MTMHTLPRNQGQTVEVAYGQRDGLVFRRRLDRSTQTETWAVSTILAHDTGDYWQQAPRNRRWRTITQPEMEQD